MFCDIDPITLLNAAIKQFGPNVQVGKVTYIDTIGEYITVYVTPYHTRSLKCRFYYKKGSFDHKDPERKESENI